MGNSSTTLSPVNLLQFVDIAELKTAHEAGVHAYRVASLIAHVFAYAALDCDVLFLEVLRLPVGACSDACLATDARLLVVLHGAVVLVDVHRTDGAAGYAGRTEAVVACT